ncbi:hypothetical protein [Bradyrhizobium sp. Arg816]|uniref:hypothetical protein n=1 Tax=Bradyrhizobium sp. Arg816 TaxID=2998491 RepID=UPI00249E9CC7|nr:hypothetical protein [Bradyrhizobium sp. Arg816]MDI3562577.1 hypothetical protein [Bradyrhizobium sp. Arg816]
MCYRLIGSGDHLCKGQLHGLEVRLNAGKDLLREYVENAIGALEHDEAPRSAGAQERLSATEAISYSVMRNISSANPD